MVILDLQVENLCYLLGEKIKTQSKQHFCQMHMLDIPSKILGKKTKGFRLKIFPWPILTMMEILICGSNQREE